MKEWAILLLGATVSEPLLAAIFDMSLKQAAFVEFILATAAIVCAILYVGDTLGRNISQRDVPAGHRDSVLGGDGSSQSKS